MRYLHYQLDGKKGGLVKVHFNKPTRVMLLSALDYKKYSLHRSYHYKGGNLSNSPHEFSLLRDGRYHVVVELGSWHEPMKIKARVEVLTAREARELKGEQEPARPAAAGASAETTEAAPEQAAETSPAAEAAVAAEAEKPAKKGLFGKKKKKKKKD